MGRGGLLFAVVWLACAATQGGAQERDPIAVGAWAGGAFSDEDGRYLYCAVAARDRNGINLVFHWWADGLGLSLHADDWRLPENDTYTVRAAVDRRWSARIAGDTGGSSIHFDLGHDTAAIEAIRLGRILTIDTAQATFRFSLSGTNAAIAAIQACHARNDPADPAGRGDTASRPSARPAAGTASGAFRRLPEPVLGFNAFQSFILGSVSPSAIVMMPEADDDWNHYAFEETSGLGTVLGSYVEVDPAGLSTAELLADAFTGIRLQCDGRVVSGSDPIRTVKRTELVAGFIACEYEDSAINTLVAILNTGSYAQIYRIVADDAGSEDARILADNLFQSMQEFALELARTR